MEPMTAETINCPTCRAAQVWSDTCRRCKCDLSLLRAMADHYDALRRQCLASLRENLPRSALEHARQCFALRTDDEARRLLAVCELLNGNWPSARDLATQLLTDRQLDE